MINRKCFNTGWKCCFCEQPEKIENYDKAVADTTQTWHCHHRLETHTSDGERRLVDISKKELIALGTYYNRPPEELIFLTVKEHRKLHNGGMKGKHHSEEVKKRMSEAKIGKPHPMSEETKKKISKPHNCEWREKISKAMKGKKRGPYRIKYKHWKLVDGKRVYY